MTYRPLGPWRAFLVRCGVRKEDWELADAVVLSALAIVAMVVVLWVLHGCESRACQIVGDCAEPPTVRNSLVGGTSHLQRSRTGSDSCACRYGLKRQPPIILQALAPAAESGPPSGGTAAIGLVGNADGGLRFEERDSGRGVESSSTRAKDDGVARLTMGRVRQAAGENPAGRYPPSLDAFLEAIIAYESRNETVLVGDGGDSRGPAHIQLAYWIDTGRRAEDWHRGVMDREESKRCMVDYFRRYEPEALANGDWETLARLHNGGPNWRQKLAATDGYWVKAKERML